MVGVNQVMQAFQQGMTAAPPVTFDQQLRIFSNPLQPLCWMAVPEFCCQPVGVSSPDGDLRLRSLLQPQPSATPLEQVLGSGR